MNLFTLEVGLRQCCNLSPLLFAIYLNDFLSKYYECITLNVQIYTLLYADDTIIIMAESEQDQQTALDAAFSYCKI